PSQTTWSSAGDPIPDREEWVAVQFTEPRKIDAVEVVPRWNGPKRSGAFPEDFEVQISRDGERWTTVVSKRGYPAPEGAIPQRFTFHPVEALAVRFRATKLRMANTPNTYYCQLAEMRASLGDGPNYALAARGAVATASSCVSGVTKRRNDLDWLTALECGAKWVRLPAATWERVETERGRYYADPMLDQAVESATGWGVRLVLPLTVTNGLYAEASRRRDAFAAYCRALMRRYGRRVSAWALVVNPDEVSAQVCAEAVTIMARELKTHDPRASLMLGDIPLENTLYLKQVLRDRATAASVDIVSVLARRPLGAVDDALQRYRRQVRQLQTSLRDAGCAATVWSADLSNWLAAAGRRSPSDEQMAAGLLFHCSFDESPTADYSKGDGSARRKRASDTRFVHPGAGNGYGAIAVESPDVLSYAREGNFDPERGMISLWAKPLKPLDDDENHVFFALGDQEGPGIQLWKTGLHNDLRFRVAFAPGKLADAVVPLGPNWAVGEWRLIVARWDCQKGALELRLGDAPPAKARFAPATLEGLPARFYVGCTASGGQADAVVDGLRIYGSPTAQVPPVADPLAASDMLVRLIVLNQQLGVVSCFDADSEPGGLVTIAGNPRYPLYALRACATAFSPPLREPGSVRVRAEPSAGRECEVRALRQADGRTVVAIWTTGDDEGSWVRLMIPFEGQARVLGLDPQAFMIEELAADSDGNSVTCEVFATKNPRLVCVVPAWS
ncbi:MAG: discoidin domain-containing protein, partial [Armatimonadota bacterium]